MLQTVMQIDLNLQRRPQMSMCIHYTERSEHTQTFSGPRWQKKNLTSVCFVFFNDET